MTKFADAEFSQDMAELPFTHRRMTGKHVPSPKARERLRKFTILPHDDFLCTWLENQPLEVYEMRTYILRSLDVGLVAEAKAALDQLRTRPGFESGVNRQFLLCQDVRVMNLTHQPPEDIIPIVYEALQITWQKFHEHSLGDSTLLYEEPRLLQALANTRARMNDAQTAISLLEFATRDLQTHLDEHESSNILIHMLHDLANYYLQDKQYGRAIETCDMGHHISIMRRRGGFLPDLCYTKALVLKESKGSEPEWKYLLLQAYFGSLLLKRKDQAKNVLASAIVDFDYVIETWGAEKLEMGTGASTLPTLQLREGVGCATLNEMVQTLRNELEMTLRQLAEGLCPPGTLSKFENNQISNVQLYFLEPILQRLGYGIDPYCNVFLSDEAYETRKKRDEVLQLLTTQQFAEAERILSELEALGSYKAYANLQFILSAKATIYQGRNGYDKTYSQMLHSALAVTWPDFNEADISRRQLTYYEALLVNQLGNYYMMNHELEQAYKIFSQLYERQCTQYNDDGIKAMLYSAVAHNYIACLIGLKYWDKAIDISNQTIDFESANNRMHNLPELAGNRAYICVMHEGEDCLPYLALAYYGLAMYESHGQEKNKDSVHLFAYKQCGVDFNEAF